jgi:hypothetical protein
MAKQDNYFLLEALVQKLEGEVAVHKANIQVYMQSSTGIGEHPQLIEAIETEIAKLAESQEKLDTIDRHFQV